MRPARWGVSMAFATVGARAWGEVAAHVFVDGSSAPVCQPRAHGEPGALHDSRGASHCSKCFDLLVHASWATTSYGAKRLWVVWVGSRDGKEKADGIAANDTEAFAMALAEIERQLPPNAPTQVVRLGEGAALTVARERRAEARSKRISSATGAQVVEHVYRHHKRWRSWSDHAFTWETERAKVLRKTRKRLFVEDTIGTYTTAGGVMVLKTYALDREALERGTHRYGWTLNPHPPADGSASSPGWAEVLGVEVPCTFAQAKRAFRSAAKVAHPDNGGSDAAFRRVKAAFDAAAQQLGGAS